MEQKNQGEPKNEYKPPNYIHRVKDKAVIVTFNNGSELNGTIDGFNPYEIRLIVDDGRDLLIFKSNIRYIEGDFSHKK